MEKIFYIKEFLESSIYREPPIIHFVGFNYKGNVNEAFISHVIYYKLLFNKNFKIGLN